MATKTDPSSAPQPGDLLWHWFYRLAYRLSLLFFFIFRPAIHGVNVAVWHRNRLLIIKHSYKSECGLPGGYIGRNESTVAAAVRELKEEVAVIAAPQQLHLVGDFSARHEFKRDTVTLFEFYPDSLPQVLPDQREVIWARYVPLETALRLQLSPMIRKYLRSRPPGPSHAFHL